MVNSFVEELSENISQANTETSEEKEYALLSELSESQQLKMELIESIRHAVLSI